MVDVTEILVHWYAGRKLAEIARSLRVDRKTARKYVDGARMQGLRPGGPEVAQEQWAAWVREWFPELVKPEARSSTFAEISCYRDYIAGALQTNTVSTIHQRLRDEHGLLAGLSSLRRYVRLEFPAAVAQSAITVLKDDPPPGEEAQIDYGYLGIWIEPLTGRRRRVWAFSMLLSNSRHMFVRPVLNMTLPLWIECHVAAFQFFDGVPLRWVPDYVARHIIELLWPAQLCDQRRRGQPRRREMAAAATKTGHITITARRAISVASHPSSRLVWCGVPPRNPEVP